jgi:F-type H+-transporting ATPase subunit b
MATEPTTIEEGTPIESHAETAQAEHAEGGIAGVIDTFGLRGDLFLAQLVNFLIVLLVLWKFAYKPILKMLAEREKKIETSVKQADAIEKRLNETTLEKEQILGEARKEAQLLIAKAMSDTEERKAEMVEAAKKEVERVIEKGKEQLKAEQAKMLIEARKELVEIAVKAAGKIVSDNIDEKKSKSMAEEVVRKLT